MKKAHREEEKRTFSKLFFTRSARENSIKFSTHTPRNNKNNDNMADTLEYSAIDLITNGPKVPGSCVMDATGVTWTATDDSIPKENEAGAGGDQSKKKKKKIFAPASDIKEINYSQVPGGVQVLLRTKPEKGPAKSIVLQGFRGADVKPLKEFVSAKFENVRVRQRECQPNGRNWGDIVVSNSNFKFEVNEKCSFEVNAAAIAGVNPIGKNDLIVELQQGRESEKTSKDALVEMAFYVPLTAETWAGEDVDDADDMAVQRLATAIDAIAATGPALGEPVCAFEDANLVVPRGKVTFALHPNFVRVTGSAADFKINYTSVVRVYALPKPNSHQTHVVVALDPPIRKGQTFYSFIVTVFNDDDIITVAPRKPNKETDDIEITGEMEERFKNVEEEYTGAAGEVFARVLKAVAGVKLTRQGTFVSPAGGSAIRVSHKADVGLLYLLERGFFYLPKPPILVRYEDVSECEFERHGGGAGASKTFDLTLTTKKGLSYQFHGISRTEFQNLVNFLTAKGLPIGEVDANALADRLIDEDDMAGLDDGPDLERGSDEDEDSEEDEDFKGGSESDGGEPTDSSSSESDSDSDSESDGGKKKKPAKKKAKTNSGSPAAKKKEKDPNAPKRPLSTYMIFSAEMRAKVKEENPDFSITDVAKELGVRWKAVTGDEKEKYEELAKKDKERYEREMEEYKKTGGKVKKEEDGGDEEMADAADEEPKKEEEDA